MKEIRLTPIRIIHVLYTESKNIPIQGILKKEIEGWIELNEKYVAGLKYLYEFSHVILK